jgi:gluconolactonase
MSARCERQDASRTIDASPLGAPSDLWHHAREEKRMLGEIVAEKLAFPEGPVWHAGALYLVEIAGGSIARYVPGQPDRNVERIATTGGGPNGATLGPNNALYVTQNGGMGAENRVTPALLCVGLDGEINTVTTEVAGIRLEGPNDLAFGPDRRLYFTDPRGEADAARNHKPGRLFAWDLARASGELLLELGPVFPNGIAFDREGSLIWTESFSRRVMRLSQGRPELVIELPERHFPDGFCIGADGRLYVASTYAHCVSVIAEGKLVERLMCGDGMPTNCCFAGTDLYVTESRRGTLWRFPIGTEGLALGRGPGS